jgi:hypothetical protein
MRIDTSTIADRNASEPAERRPFKERHGDAESILCAERANMRTTTIKMTFATD